MTNDAQQPHRLSSKVLMACQTPNHECLKLAEDVDRYREYVRIYGSFKLLNIPKAVQALVLEALHSDQWDWFKECDGCTCVSEPGWPSKYYPPCVRHDYEWRTGRGGWDSNARFYALSRAYHMEGWRSGMRWFGVTLGWYGWMKWWKMLAG